jgi:hypothetical protein
VESEDFTSYITLFQDGLTEDQARIIDPLSPMLVLLVMEALNSLMLKAEEWSLFKPLGIQAIAHRASLYTDDLAWFVTPDQQDLQLVRNILDVFEKASGLGCNMGKCQLAPIRCDNEQIAHMLAVLSCSVVDFPMKYLGIPLSVSKLPKSALQPMVLRTGFQFGKVVYSIDVVD